MITKTLTYTKGTEVYVTITPDIAPSSYSDVYFELKQSAAISSDGTYLCKLSKVKSDGGFTPAISAGSTTFTVTLSSTITTAALDVAYDLKLTLIKTTGSKKYITIYRSAFIFTEF